MDPREKRERMRRMRRVVKHYNIYRWAANLIGAASEVRLDPIQRAKAAIQSNASTTVRSSFR
jgi:trehalose-6-phosphate synthase